MSLTSPATAARRAKRFQQIVNVLYRHGFGETLKRIRAWESFASVRNIRRRKQEIAVLPEAARLRLALEELGPAFVKIGQVLSSRPDLIPPEIIVELKKLQTSGLVLPVERIRTVIETELGSPIEEMFDSFDETPLAAASLAQVHRAVLKGQHVVIKVQRPAIADIIEDDIAIMRDIAQLAERYSHAASLLNITGVVDEFATQIHKELDFELEAANMDRYRRNFSGDHSIRVPQSYPELSTKLVLTMDYLEAIKISETQKLRDEGYNLKLIAKRGAMISFKSVFQFGFFHADPHPGNIVVLPDDVIGMIDFGMMATLALRDRERLALLVQSLAVRDETRAARSLRDLMETGEIFAEDLEPAIAIIITEYRDVPAAEINLAGMLFAMIRSIIKLGGRFRPPLLWSAKNLALLEDVAHSLGADFNIMDIGMPYARRLLSQKLTPFRRPYEISSWLMEAFDSVKDIPYGINIIMRKLRRGKFRLEFEHFGLEPIRLTLERVTNRLVLSLIIAALLVSSSLIVNTNLPPFTGTMPTLAVVGYLAAMLLGIILVFSIWSGKTKGK